MSETTVELFLVRHGETILNAIGRVQGWSDAPLTPVGVRQAEALGRGLQLEGITFDSVYTSDTMRAQQTADLVLSSSGHSDLSNSLVTDWRLREVNFGSFEGMTQDKVHRIHAERRDEVARRSDAAADQNRENDTARFMDTLVELDRQRGGHEITWPAEDYLTVVQRAWTAMNEAATTQASRGGGRLLLVAHGMTISILLEQLDAADLLPAGGLQNASVSVLRHTNGEYKVKRVGDTSFVRSGEA